MCDAQLQNRQQNNPLIIAGVAIVLITMLAKVPLWMWSIMAAIAGG